MSTNSSLTPDWAAREGHKERQNSVVVDVNKTYASSFSHTPHGAASSMKSSRGIPDRQFVFLKKVLIISKLSSKIANVSA
jgi:hypothetical protein